MISHISSWWELRHCQQFMLLTTAKPSQPSKKEFKNDIPSSAKNR